MSWLDKGPTPEDMDQAERERDRELAGPARTEYGTLVEIALLILLMTVMLVIAIVGIMLAPSRLLGFLAPW